MAIIPRRTLRLFDIAGPEMVAGQAAKGRYPRRGSSPDILSCAVLIRQCYGMHNLSAGRLSMTASDIASLQKLQRLLQVRCSELKHTVRGSSGPASGGMPATPH
jgi:hypothetical protein